MTEPDWSIYGLNVSRFYLYSNVKCYTARNETLPWHGLGDVLSTEETASLISEVD